MKRRVLLIMMMVTVLIVALSGCSFINEKPIISTDQALETDPNVAIIESTKADAAEPVKTDIAAQSDAATTASMPAPASPSAKVAETKVPQPEPEVFILIDLSEQTLWALKGAEVTDSPDGCQVIYETGIVSGTKDTECATPTGTYDVRRKDRGTYLYPSTGEPVWVNYWIPFIDNEVGMHDAWWRKDGEFGTDQYQDSGSHGCINLPSEAAATIYHIVRIGTTVRIVE